jgi:hypothetical protein
MALFQAQADLYSQLLHLLHTFAYDVLLLQRRLS